MTHEAGLSPPEAGFSMRSRFIEVFGGVTANSPTYLCGATSSIGDGRWRPLAIVESDGTAAREVADVVGAAVGTLDDARCFD